MLTCRLLIGLAVILAVFTDEAFSAAQRIDSFHCIIDDQLNTLNATFTWKLNGDPINLVYGLLFNTTTQIYDYKDCGFYKHENDEYLTVQLGVYLDSPFQLISDNPCGIQVDVAGEVFTWYLALRETEGFFKRFDRDYEASCNSSDTYSNFLRASIDVSDPAVVTPTVINPSVKFEVLRQRSNAGTNVPYLPSTSCKIGENMKLRVTLDHSSYIDYVSPSSLELIDTRVAPELDILMDPTDDLNFQLVNEIGCAVSPSVLYLDNGWTMNPSNNVYPTVFETGVFMCNRFLDYDELWFSSYFYLCFGFDERNNKCNDICDFNFRQRRQASDIDAGNRTVTVRVTVISDENNDDHVSSSGMSTSLLVAMVTSIVFVLVALVSAVVCLCVVKQKRRFSEDSSSNADSRATSERKLPM